MNTLAIAPIILFLTLLIISVLHSCNLHIIFAFSDVTQGVLKDPLSLMSAKTKGEEMNIRARAVDYKLRTLLNKSYTLRTGYGTFQKAGAKVRRQAA